MSLVNTIQKLFPNLKDIKSFKSSSSGYSLKYKGFVQSEEYMEETEKLLDKHVKAKEDLQEAKEELEELLAKLQVSESCEPTFNKDVKACEDYVKACEECVQASLDHLNTHEENQNSEESEGVVIKVSFEPYVRQYNSQIVEGQIYRNVLRKLRNNTPHLPKLYGVKKFDTCEISERERAKINSWEDDIFNTCTGQVLVVKNVGPTTLWSIWEDECNNPHIAFQVLYTIACFERVGLKHNDLHLNNIFVQIADEPYKLKYEIDGKVVSFTTKKLVKIIDYDRSSIYHEDVERNGCLDDFQQSDDPINQYNGPNKGHDTFKFLRGYNYSFVSGQLKLWIKFQCPTIFQTDCRNDLLSQDVNPRNIVPDTVSLLKSLVENFTDHFTSVSEESDDGYDSDCVSLLKSLVEDFTDHFSTVSEESDGDSECVIWRLPEDTAIKPIVDTIKFPVCKITRWFNNNNESHMYKELRSLGYDWRLHHCKLFDQVKDYVKTIIPDAKDHHIYKACINVTNPLRKECLDVLESLILHKFKLKPVIFIPQKHVLYSGKKPEVLKQEEDDDDEDEDEDDDDDNNNDEDEDDEDDQEKNKA